jgi:hypothetical protein
MLPPAVRNRASFPRGKIVALSCVLAVWFASVEPASAAIINVIPSTPSVAVGDTFSVTFDVEGVTDLYAFQFGIFFDKTILSFVLDSVTEGAFLATAGTTDFVPGFYDQMDPTTAPAAVLFNAAALIGPVSGASEGGALLTASFKALAAGTTTISAVFDPVAGDGLFDFLFTDVLPYGAIPEGEVFPAPVAFGGSVSVLAPPPTQVPEPGTLSLFAAGIAASAVSARRRRRAAGRLRH